MRETLALVPYNKNEKKSCLALDNNKNEKKSCLALDIFFFLFPLYRETK
jgi:hypothetical protein